MLSASSPMWLLMRRAELLQRNFRRIPLSPHDTDELLKLCLSTASFQWRNNFYEQNSGAAMGSQVSPIMANIFMEDFEKKALSGSSMAPKLWKRYVDDTFVIWALGINRLHEFLEYLNSINPSIQFTTATQDSNQSLPFLDIFITKKT